MYVNVLLNKYLIQTRRHPSNTYFFFKGGHLCVKGKTIFVPNFLYPSVSLEISLLHFISPFRCLYMLYVVCACVCAFYVSLYVVCIQC